MFVTPGDPVASGLVSSLAHPGGNMTGMTFEFPELAGKRLELLKEITPRAKRVLIIFDPRDASPMQGVAVIREAAPKLGVTLLEREVRSQEDVTKALGALGRAQAFLAIPGGVPHRPLRGDDPNGECQAGSHDVSCPDGQHVGRAGELWHK